MQGSSSNSCIRGLIERFNLNYDYAANALNAQTPEVSKPYLDDMNYVYRCLYSLNQNHPSLQEMGNRIQIIQQASSQSMNGLIGSLQTLSLEPKDKQENSPNLPMINSVLDQHDQQKMGRRGAILDGDEGLKRLEEWLIEPVSSKKSLGKKSWEQLQIYMKQDLKKHQINTNLLSIKARHCLAAIYQYQHHNSTSCPPAGYGLTGPYDRNNPLYYFRSQKKHPYRTEIQEPCINREHLNYLGRNRDTPWHIMYSGLVGSNIDFTAKRLNYQHKIPPIDIRNPRDDIKRFNDVQKECQKKLHDQDLRHKDLPHKGLLKDSLDERIGFASDIVNNDFIKNLKKLTVSYPADSANLFIKLPKPKKSGTVNGYKIKSDNHKEGWVNVVLSFFAGLLNHYCEKNYLAIYTCRRQSFGFSRPTLTDTGDSLRLSMANTSKCYVNCVIDSLIKLEQALTQQDDYIAAIALIAVEGAQTNDNHSTKNTGNFYRAAMRSEVRKHNCVAHAKKIIYKNPDKGPFIDYGFSEFILEAIILPVWRDKCFSYRNGDLKERTKNTLTGEETKKFKGRNGVLKKIFELPIRCTYYPDVYQTLLTISNDPSPPINWKFYRKKDKKKYDTENVKEIVIDESVSRHNNYLQYSTQQAYINGSRSPVTKSRMSVLNQLEQLLAYVGNCMVKWCSENKKTSCAENFHLTNSYCYAFNKLYNNYKKGLFLLENQSKYQTKPYLRAHLYSKAVNVIDVLLENIIIIKAIKRFDKEIKQEAKIKKADKYLIEKCFCDSYPLFIRCNSGQAANSCALTTMTRLIYKKTLDNIDPTKPSIALISPYYEVKEWLHKFGFKDKYLEFDANKRIIFCDCSANISEKTQQKANSLIELYDKLKENDALIVDITNAVLNSQLVTDLYHSWRGDQTKWLIFTSSMLKHEQFGLDKYQAGRIILLGPRPYQPLIKQISLGEDSNPRGSAEYRQAWKVLYDLNIISQRSTYDVNEDYFNMMHKLLYS